MTAAELVPDCSDPKNKKFLRPHCNAKESKPLFLSVQIPERGDSPVNESVVKIEIRRGKAVVSLEWPVSQIALSTSLIKELMS
jgi:hypothetical protein